MAEPFNIDRFMDRSGRVDLSDIDWSAVPRQRLTPEELRTLRYFLVTEGSTFFYVKGLMATRASIEEPDFAPFLCAWMYEEEFHGRAFRRFLEAYGEAIPSSYRGQAYASRTAGERIDELGQAALSQLFPEAWPAVHMVWGTIQEWTTYAAYQALIDRTCHPILTVLCERIMKQELRHFAFYREHARKRLAASRSAQRLTTYALKLAWTPVGDGMSERADVCHAIRYLFDGADGTAIRAIERKVRELPGLEWFDLFTRFVERHDIRRAPASWAPRRRAASAVAPPAVAMEA
jgi:hypothetical protein